MTGMGRGEGTDSKFAVMDMKSTITDLRSKISGSLILLTLRAFVFERLEDTRYRQEYKVYSFNTDS